MLKFIPQIQSFVPTVESRIEMGHVLMRSQRIDEALTEFLAVLEIAPELMYIHMTVGGIYIRKHQYPKALAAFQTAITLDPLAPHPPLAVAQVYLHQQQLDLAIEYFQLALTLDPQLDMAYVGLGHVALKQQRLAAALEALQTALGLSPDLVEARLLLADAYCQSGVPDQAIALLEIIPPDAHQAPLARLKLARIYQKQQRYRAARTILEEVRAAAPLILNISPEARLDLVETYLADGVTASTQAIAIDTLTESDDFLQLAYRKQLLQGNIKMQQGNPDQAVRHYLQAWQIQMLIQAQDPQHQPSRPSLMSTDSSTEKSLLTALSNALQQQQLDFFYQPIVSLTTRQVVGCEALLRWSALANPWQLPTQFLPVAEASGLILPIGWWSLFRVCWQLAHWQREVSLPWISLNLSGSQLQDPNLPLQIQLALQAAALPPTALHLELDQQSLLNLEPTIWESLAALPTPLSITIQDLEQPWQSWVSRPEIATIKIGPNLLQQLTASEPRRLIQSMIDQSLVNKKSVIAIGVETLKQAIQLTAMGCPNAQGYLLGQPNSSDLFIGAHFGKGEFGDSHAQLHATQA